MQFNAYTISLFVAAAVSGALAVYGWRRRAVPAGTEFAVLMLAVALWALFQGMEGVATTLFAKQFWGAATYLGSQTTPVLLLLFAVRYTQHDSWLSLRRIALLMVVPFVSVVMAFTWGAQHLLWLNVTLTHTGAGITDVYAHGPWFWVEVAYGYALIFIAVVLLLRAVVRLPHLYSWQARLMILATLVPLVGHIVYTFSPSSVARLDITPITFTITGALVAAALFRYRLLDLRPIASSVLYEGMGDAMVAIDTEGRVVDINPAASSVLRTAPDAVIGRPVESVFSALPVLAAQLAPEVVNARGEIELAVDDGQHAFDVRVWPLRDRRGHLMGRLLTLHDVTELRLAREELERINAALEGFAHTVSHDLKGPLTTISLANEAIARLLEQPESENRNRIIDDMLHSVGENTRKASGLINSLLALAKAGQRPVAVNEVSVDATVKRILEEMSARIDERGATVTADALGTVTADPTQIYQLFSNLLGNALQHNDNPLPELRVRLLASEPGRYRYSVCDNGGGIPAQDLEKVFEPFYSAGESGTTGIGLSTVMRIVQMYGGEIRAYNDDGACFEFTLNDYELEERP